MFLLTVKMSLNKISLHLVLCISQCTNLNQQPNYIMFYTTVNSHNFDWVAFSKNFYFLIEKDAEKKVSALQEHL